jgi:hypothetical protein
MEFVCLLVFVFSSYLEFLTINKVDSGYIFVPPQPHDPVFTHKC